MVTIKEIGLYMLGFYLYKQRFTSLQTKPGLVFNSVQMLTGELFLKNSLSNKSR